MDAARLVKVPDSISRGINALPSAGSTSGVLVHGTAGAGPTPTAAPNSGRKLDNSLLAPSNKISNGQGRQYDGSPDNDEDDRPLKSSGNGSTGGDFRPKADSGRL